MINEINYRGLDGKRLKATFYQNKDPNAPIAFVCYPETCKSIPSQTEIVVDMLKKFEFSILVFNFQKIESGREIKSDQLSDIIYSFNWIREYYTYAREIWCFFFFQACIPGQRIIMRRPEIVNYVLYSPTVPTYADYAKYTKKERNFIAPPGSNGILFYDDSVSNLASDIVNNNPYSEKVNFTTYHITDLNTMTEESKKHIEEFIEQRLTVDFAKRNIKPKKDRRRRRKTKNFDEEKRVIIDPIQPLNFDF